MNFFLEQLKNLQNYLVNALQYTLEYLTEIIHNNRNNVFKNIFWVGKLWNKTIYEVFCTYAIILNVITFKTTNEKKCK